MHEEKNHWTLIIIDNDQKTVRYYNPTRDSGYKYLSKIRVFMQTEMMLRKQTDFFSENWFFNEQHDGPYQDVEKNSNDCGVLLCNTAKMLAERKQPDYPTAEIDMVNLRKKIAYELYFKILTD